MKKISIWKFPLQVTEGLQVLNLPVGAVKLSLHLVAGTPSLYAVVDTEERNTEPRTFYMLGTGWDASRCKPQDEYLGTLVINDLVWHYFEEIE